MRLTVYGSNATCPEAGGACACFLLEAAGKKILLDMGSGSLAKLQKDLDLAELDAIVLSHLHFDHFGDLFCAKYQLESRAANGETLRPIPLISPALPQWAREELYTNGVFTPRLIQDGGECAVGEARVRFYRTVHLNEAYGMRVTAGGKTVAYSGDSGACPQLARIAAGADLFVCEATLVQGMHAEEGHHLRAATAGQLAAQNGVKQLLLAHYHGPQAAQALREAREWFANTDLARIGACVEV